MRTPETLRERRLRIHRAKHFVYELWAEDECLYVGMTSRLGQRLEAHALKPWYAGVTRVAASAVTGDRHQALHVEAERLDQLQPTHNIYGTDRRGRLVPRGD